MSGTITTRPKKPNTTDGIPAKISTTDFKKNAEPGDAISEIYIADARPIGIATHIEPKVTRSVPKIKGISPKRGFEDVGYQYSPEKNSKNGYFSKKTNPSLNKNKQRRKRENTTIKETALRVTPVPFSTLSLNTLSDPIIYVIVKQNYRKTKIIESTD